ncbi:hypothetical protein LLE87_36995, partial [Paenibacillus polymyxa]|nr:hypothetical protein [Paenibacillus polymyxa]
LRPVCVTRKFVVQALKQSAAPNLQLSSEGAGGGSICDPAADDDGPRRRGGFKEGSGWPHLRALKALCTGLPEWRS